MQPDHPELRAGHEAGGDRAALKARRQPPGIRRIPLRPPGQVLDLLGIRQHALEPLGLQPVEWALPVVAVASITTAGTCQLRSQSASASTSRLVVPKLRVSLARRAGLLSDGTRIVATIWALPISVPHTRSRYSGSSVTSSTCCSPDLSLMDCSPARQYRPGNRGRAEESNPRARSNNEQPLRKPAPGVRLIGGLDRTKKVTTSRAVPQPFFTPVRRRASGTKG